MRITNEVLISFFDSNEAALQGLRLIAQERDRHVRRTQALLVSRNADGSRSPVEPPEAWPVGGVLGAGVGGLLGSLAGESGAVVGLILGLSVGFFLDLWRTVARADLLDLVQDGLAPGQAAVVVFGRRSSAASIERALDTPDAVTVHRFPGNALEDDLAREARETVAALGRLGAADDAGGEINDRERRIEAARRKLSVLGSIADRLMWLERLQFGFETGVLNRELRETPPWRSRRLRRRAVHARASHRRTMSVLEASSARVRAAEALVVAAPRPSSADRPLRSDER